MQLVTAIMATVEYRAYDSFPKRMEMGKKTHNNAANYVGLLLTYLDNPCNENAKQPDLSGLIAAAPVPKLNRPTGNWSLFHFSP